MSVSVRCFRLLSYALILTIGATVSAFSQRIIASSEYQVDFGNIPVGSSTTHTITLTNMSSAPVDILGAETAGSDAFMAKFNANVPLTLDARQSVTLVINFYPTTSGTKQGALRIFNNSVDSVTYVALVGTGGVQLPRMTVSPTALDFGNVRLNTTTSLTVSVTNPATSAQSLMWVTAGRNGIPGIFTVGVSSFPIQIAAGATYTFSVSCTPTDLGDVSEWLMIAQGGSGMLSMDSILLSCTGVQRIKNSGGSELVISKPKDQKGDVEVGSNNTIAFDVVNNGTQDMVIETAQIGGKDKSVFTIGNTLPFTVKPGMNDKLNIICKPNVAGTLQATVTIGVKDAGNADIPVSAVASGVSSAESENSISFTVYPNPSNGSVSITLPENSNRVEVLNTTGSLLQSFDVTNLSTLVWNACNANGMRVANGVYFVRLHTAQGVATTKVVVQD